MDLTEILRRPEGKTLEYKRDFSSPIGILKSLVAFANTAGGVLIVGVQDKTRNISGLTDVIAVEAKLANILAESIEPRIVPNIEILTGRKKHVIAMEVYPSAVRPHYLTQSGLKDGVYIRVGSTNRKADPVQIEQMRRYALPGSFDEQPMPEASMKELSFSAAAMYYAPTRKLNASSFKTLKVSTMIQGREVPTVGGYLLFAKDRFEHFPDSWIQAGRFAGTDKKRIIDHIEIRSPLPAIAEEAIEFVQKHLRREALIGQVRRVDKWTVPGVVLREAIINAITHTDYSERGAPIRIAIFDDRIEIENPGLLPLGLTIDDIQKGVSKLRNRVIGRVFHDFGLIEQWGSGVQRMTAACREAGLPELQFEELAARFRITIRIAKLRRAVTDPIDQTILRYLSSGDGWSTAEIGAILALSPRAARTRLVSLVKQGLVVEVGSGINDPKRQYFLMGVKEEDEL